MRTEQYFHPITNVEYVFHKDDCENWFLESVNTIPLDKPMFILCLPCEFVSIDQLMKRYFEKCSEVIHVYE